jgi:hypothetical protein
MATLLEREMDLDRDRVASMADEGGIAAAHAEAQATLAREGPGTAEDMGVAPLLLAASVVLLSAGFVVACVASAASRDRG